MAENSNPHADIIVGAQDQATPIFNQIKASSQGMATGVEQSANRAGQAVGGIGEKAEQSAQRADRAMATLSSAVKRATSEQQRALVEAQGFSLKSADGLEALARLRDLDVSAMQGQLTALRQLRSEQDAMVAAQRESASAALFEQQHQAAKRLVQDAEYVRVWTAALDQKEAAEREASAAALFEKQHQSARKLVQDAEYVRMWTAALEEKERAERQAAGQNEFVASLKRQSDAIGKTRADLLEMQAAQLGVTDRAAPFIARLREQEQAFAKTGVSAGQTSAALRQLPMQFSDIVVSLQAGQAPLTVFLQQGAQIKDSFGGAGAALKAMGGYVMGLVNPYTVAAAAVGGLAVAMYSAESAMRQQKSILTQLEATGRASMLSADQLKDLRKELKELPGVSKAFADATIAEFARTRQIGGDLFTGLSRSVADFAAATGQQVPDAAKALARAFADPAQGAKQLDEQLGILSASQTLAIQNMVEMGDKSGAQKILLEALRGTIKGLAEDGLTPLGKATDAFGDAWDRTMGGMDSGPLRAANELLGDMIGAATWLIDNLDKIKLPDFGSSGANRAAGTGAGMVLGGVLSGPLGMVLGGALGGKMGAPAQTGGASGSWDVPKDALDEQVKTVLGLTTSFKSAAGAAAELRGKAAQLTDTLAAMRAQGKAGSDTYRELEDRLKGVNEKIEAANKKGGAAARQEQSAYETLIASINAKIAANEEELKFGGRVTEADKLRVKMLAELESGSRKLTAAHKANALGLLETLDAQERQKAATAIAVRQYQEQVQLAEEAAQAYVQESKAREQGATAVSVYLQGIADTSAALELEIAGIGRTAAERQKLIDKYNVELALKKQIEAINANTGFTQEQRDTQIGRAESGAATALISKDLEAGAKRLNELLDPQKAEDFGEALASAFEGALSPLKKMTDSLVRFGKQHEKIAQGQKDLEDQVFAGLIKNAQAKATQGNLDQMSMKNEIGLYGQLASASAGFFDQNSKGYQTMQAASAAFHAAELAMTAGETIKKAVLAVINAGTNGDGYTAVARMAAVAAFIGALGVSVGGGGGGGASSGYTGIKSGGTGTVLGMEGQQSESIGNAIDILADNSKIELAYTQKMLSELTKVREGIQGLAGTASTDFFIRGFAGASFGDDFLDSGIGFFPGQKIADIIEKGVQGVGFNLIFQDGAQAMWRALDEEFTSGVGKVLSNVAETVYTAADALGLNDAALRERMLSLIPTLGDTSTYAQNGMAGMIGGGLVSLKDMTGEEIQKELEAIFSAVGDQMAAAALPALKPFQQIGEGMFETLIRVTTGIETAEYALEQFGLQAINYADIARKNGDIAVEIMRQTIMGAERELAMYRYGSAGTVVSGATPETGLASIIDTFVGDASELQELYAGLLDVRDAMKSVGAQALDLSRDMIRGAGGLEALQSGLDSYLTGFFSEQEQVDAAWARMAEDFARVGVAMPKTNEQFRAMVEGLDTSTAAGANLFGGMMSLAEAFADVTGRTDDLADAAREQAEAFAQAARDSWSALYDALDGVVADFLTAAEQKDYNAGRISMQLSEIGFTVSPEQVLGAGKDDFEALYRSIDLTTTAGREQAAALIGVYSAFKNLTGAAASLTGAADTAYQALVKSVNAEKAELKTAYDAQSAAIQAATRQAQEGAQARISAITGIFNTINSAINSTRATSDMLEMDLRRAAQARLQGAVDWAKSGKSLTNYNDLSGALSIVGQPSEDLFASFEDYARDQAATSVLMAELRDRAKGQVSVAEKTLAAIQSSGDRQLAALTAQYEADVEALDEELKFWEDQLNAVKGIDTSVLSVRDAVNNMSKAITAAIDGLSAVDGSHASGLAYVPFDGYRAELHRGETVLNAEQARLYRGGAMAQAGGGLTREDVREITALLRANVEVNDNTRIASQQTSSVLRRLDGGDGLVTKTVAEAEA